MKNRFEKAFLSLCAFDKATKVDLLVRLSHGRSVAGTKGRRPSTFCSLVFSNFTSVPNPKKN